MLITFKSKAYGEFSMMGDEAERLLKMMGHSGTVPGAINAKDVPEALEHLTRSITMAQSAEKDEQAEPAGTEEEEEKDVSISTRAFPLVEMLTAAARDDCGVMWYQ